MKTYKEIAKELRSEVETAVLIGPMRQVIDRIEHALDGFESKIEIYVESLVAKQLREYYERVEGIPDGEPTFDKEDT
jgi:uncharacterized protein Yka (UPF0111/DUF47 family)